MRTLILFSLKTAFTLAPDLIYLESCTSSAGFLGIGSSTECHEVPQLIPHTLDQPSLNLLDLYLTAVGLKMLAPKIAPPSTSLQLWQDTMNSDVPAAFEPVVAVLRGRAAKDAAAVQRASSTTVKELTSGGYSHWESSMDVQSYQAVTAEGAPQLLNMVARASGVTDPRFTTTIASVLKSAKPLVYSALSCDEHGTCSYFFLIGRTVAAGTDLVAVSESAKFEFAPRLLVVRETNSTVFGTNVTDKVREVPRNVTTADVDAVLAFFEISVSQRLSRPSARLVLAAAAATPAPTPAPTTPSPSMPGGTATPVPEWQKLVNTIATDADLAKKWPGTSPARSKRSAGKVRPRRPASPRRPGTPPGPPARPCWGTWVAC